MRTPKLLLLQLALAAFALPAAESRGQGPGTPSYWLPADGVYNDANENAWSVGFVPDVGFDEAAVITTNDNAQTPVARINSNLNTQPAAVYLGELAGESGTLRIENGGSLSIGFIDGNSALGGVNVGLGGVGYLDVAPGASLEGGYLTMGGEGGSVATFGGAGAGVTSVMLTVSGGNDAGEFGTTVGAGNTLRVVGPNVDYRTLSFTMAGGGTLAAGITGGTHSAVKSINAVGVAGTLLLEFDGVTPSVGDSWTLFDAPGVNGRFESIEVTGAPALPLGQTFVFEAEANGASTHGVYGRVSLEQQLVLKVNRDTGSVAIQNGPTGVDFDGYSISSELGAFNSALWNSLDNQGVSDWRESPTDGSGSRLSELKPTGSTGVAAGPGIELGQVFQYPTPIEFGTELEDVAFEYYTPDGDVVQASVIYEGQKFHNNLVLVVDPADGRAQLVNDSPFAVSIDGYWVGSESGSLNPGNADWSSLDDQNIGGGAWTEANPTGNSLVELQAEGATLLAAGATYNLGTLFDTAGVQDLVLQYLFPEDEEFTRFGAVDYRAVSDLLTGDYNGDGVVNAADYTVWRDSLGQDVAPGSGADGNGDGAVNQADYNVWRSNYGSSIGGGLSPAASPAPEPGAAALLIGCCVAGASRRRRASC
ncbi:hypothetical protein KOR34_01700 [Posidoniimonas corsicana]|uniref:Dockerin domain-containing protein n=1 Tax=Posidoniimonas corsicana TaxID=1938618 RepID=A0A5C5VC48_9BACT|nr:dockerin type I repeat-containing protein [Posidoniimonas corsicana]TWT35282.1 hypothetical protein KOR34_01700 [Posidoniimonas corsicana]